MSYLKKNFQAKMSRPKHPGPKRPMVQLSYKSFHIVGESQLRIPKLEPDTMVPLEYVELENHGEGVRCHHQIIQRWVVSSCARACWEHVDVGNDQLCVSQLG